jgi:predicted RNase H-like HicB family nuclease
VVGAYEFEESHQKSDIRAGIMNKFTAILHKGESSEGGFWATCLEVPGANGQGETREECLKSLGDAVRELLLLNREEALANDPDAEQTELIVA